MPSVREIDERMKRWSREWMPETPVDCQGEVFNVLWDASERYYGSNRYVIRPNYERVLGEMTSLACWLSPRPFGHPIIEAIRGGAPVAALEWLHDRSDENVGRKLVLSQQTFLLEKLANYIRGIAKPIDSRSPPIPDYMNFLRMLQDRFDLGILAVALREIGRVERTLFIIDWLLDADMQRRANTGLNKGEAHHALKNALRIGRQGEIRERSREGQHYRMAGLNLLAAIVIYWNTVLLGEAVRQRKRTGLSVKPELLAHISPLGWAHILLTGENRWPKGR